MRRAPRADLAVLAVFVSLISLAAPGCSSSSDGAGATTTAPATTTTTMREITDEEIIDDINEELRPALDGAFEPATVDCVITLLEDAGTGKLNADDVVPAYEERCGVTATEVTGVITGAALVGQGATEEQGACVADAVAALTYDEAQALDEATTNALYEGCGIDPGALDGG